jgi:hypothetical protein
MLDLLMKKLWRKNPQRLCVIESVVLAGAYVALSEELFPAVHHQLYALS